MKVIEKLASSLGRRDEVPNQELAKEIATKKDKNAVNGLVENLHHKNKDIQSDCIKVLYEIGVLDPALLADKHEDLIKLLDTSNNRLQWGAMTALQTIVLEKPDIIYKHLPQLIAVAEKGSVITKDNLMAILIKLVSVKKFSGDAFSLFIEQLMHCPSNQVPMYAENALPVITESNKAAFIETLSSRLGDFEKETKRKRVEKILNKLKGK